MAIVGFGYLYKLRMHGKGVEVISKVLMTFTLTSVLFNTFLGVTSINMSALWIMVASLSYCTLAILFLCFINLVLPRWTGITWIAPRPEHRATVICCSCCFNIGLFFFPLMQALYGTEGLAQIAFFDFPNGVYIFTVIRLIYYVLRPKCEKKDEEEKEPNSVDRAIEGSQGIPSEDIEIGQSHPEIELEEVEQSQLETDVVIQVPQAGGKARCLFIFQFLTWLREEVKTKVPCLFSPRACAIFSFLLQLLSAPALYASPLGLMFGLSGVKFPTFILTLLTTMSNANSFLAFLVLGMYLEFNIGKECWVVLIRALLYRYISGIATGIGIYYLLQSVAPDIDPIVHLVFLISFIMPAPLVNTGTVLLSPL